MGMRAADADDIAACILDVFRRDNLTATKDRAIELAGRFKKLSFALET